MLVKNVVVGVRSLLRAVEVLDHLAELSLGLDPRAPVHLSGGGRQFVAAASAGATFSARHGCC